MKWYLQSSENSDVAKSTRIRFARNIAGFPFNLKTKQEREALENKIGHQKHLTFIRGHDIVNAYKYNKRSL